MKDRIKELMEAQHMNQQTFANFTGINGATLSGIFTGRTRPTLNTIEAIEKKFPHINIEWLMFGRGGMFKTANEESNSNINSSSSQNTNPSFSPTPVSGSNTSQAHVSGITVIPADINEPVSAPQQRNQNSANLAAEPNLFDSNQQTHTVQKTIVQQPIQNQQNPIIIEKQVQPTRPPRRVTEIRVFYDDQTWEAFVPKSK